MTTQDATIRRTLSIKSKLFVQGFAVLFGTAVVAAVTLMTVTDIKINGPVYKAIVADKDLLADILPPPGYIIESYLAAHRIVDLKPAELPAMKKEITRLRDEYEARMTYWSKELSAGPIRETLLTTSAESARTFFKAVDEKLVPAVEAGENDRARNIVEAELSPLYARHRASINALVPLVTARAAESEVAATSRVRAGLWSMFAASAAVGLGCAAMCWLIGSSILMGIKRARKFADALAAGDLTVRAKMKSTDELGQLGASLDAAMRSIETLLIDVGSNATQVAGAATQIAAAAEEMSASVTEVARQTAQCTDSAKAAGDSATQGGQTVEQTIGEIHKIDQAVSASAASVSELGKRGEEIGAVIKVINDIADQTNLLALNAAIEAARAGEHGRGFAVVADEVRKLAERTTKATEQVARSIQSIQTETKQAVERMARGTEQVKNGVQLAQRAGENLRQIVDGASEVSMLVQSIGSASQEAGAGAQESASAAADLSSKAEHLLDVIKQFKVGPQRSEASKGHAAVRGNRSSGSPV